MATTRVMMVRTHQEITATGGVRRLKGGTYHNFVESDLEKYRGYYALVGSDDEVLVSEADVIEAEGSTWAVDEGPNDDDLSVEVLSDLVAKALAERVDQTADAETHESEALEAEAPDAVAPELETTEKE